MSLERYKAWKHRNDERKKEREIEEHKQTIKVLKRERDRRIRQEQVGKAKVGFKGLKRFVGRITPPQQQLHPKPFSKVANRNGR
jgi:hypothetical protein